MMMVDEISGVGGVPRPIDNRPAASRRQEEAESVRREDGVEISPEARRAAEVSRLVQTAKSLPDVREDRVERARDNIESGRHHDEEVVRQTAERLIDDLA